MSGKRKAAKRKAKDLAPRFNAYKPVMFSDGITTWTHHTFDTTVPQTDADREALEKYCNVGQPEYRILQLKANISELGEIAKITNPYIKVHAERISEIIESERLTKAILRLRTTAPIPINQDELKELDEADQAWQKITILRDVMPAALERKKFVGRKPGSYGPIRKAIADTLKKNPAIKNEDLWSALAEKPPRGWTFHVNRAGKYIEGPKAGDGMYYPRFRNIASEEREKLKR